MFDGRQPKNRGPGLIFPVPRVVDDGSPIDSTLIDFCELRRKVSMEQVLELIHWQPAARRGNQLRGRCPFHKSTGEETRIFSVNLAKHAFQCFKCKEKGNHLDLFMKLSELSLYDGAIELCRQLGIEPPWKS